MKKLFSLILAFILLISITACADDSAEKKTSSKLPFESMRFSFCSGASSWSTELVLNGDGTFTGNYMDKEFCKNTLKVLLSAVVALLGYFVFKIFLPTVLSGRYSFLAGLIVCAVIYVGMLLVSGTLKKLYKR